jgi:hypothetical protein
MAEPTEEGATIVLEFKTESDETQGEAETEPGIALRAVPARRSIATEPTVFSLTKSDIRDEAADALAFEQYKSLRGIWKLDFPLRDLLQGRVYIDSLRHLGLLLFESAIIACFGILYLYGLAAIPFTKEGDPKYYDPLLVAFFFFLTIFLVVLIIGYGFFVLLYGFHKSRPLIFWTLLPGTAACCLFLVLQAAGIEPWFYVMDLAFYGLLGIVFFNSVRVMANIVFPVDGEGKRDKKAVMGMINAYLLPLTVHTIIIAIYNFIIIPYYRVFKSEWEKGLFRLLVHPLLCQINLGIAAYFCKRYPNVEHHLTVGVVFGVWVETAMLGRFMIATVGTTAGSVGTAAAVGAVDILVRAFTRKKEHILNYAFWKILKSDDYDQRKEISYLAQFNNNMMVVDTISVLVMPFLLKFFWKHRLLFNFSYDTVPPTDIDLFTNAAAQFCIELISHFVCIVLETHLKIPDIKSWRRHRVVYIIWEVLNYIQILTLIIYVFKTLPAVFFCTSTDPCSCTKGGYQELALLKAEGLCNFNNTGT